MQRFALLALALPLFLLALSACGGSDEGENGGDEPKLVKIDQSKQIHILTADKVAILDPHATSDGGDTKVIIQVYETLVRVDPHDVTKLVGVLAETHSIDTSNPEQHSLVFKIREGASFHDDTKVDAAAVKKSLERIAFGTPEPSARPYGDEYASISEIVADDMTLTIKLKDASGQITLRNLTMFPASIISPKVIDATAEMSGPEATAHISNNPIGSGPFKVESFDSSTGITRLAANAKYWGGAPKIESVIYEQVSDNVVRFERFSKGDVELCDELPRQRWPEVESNKNLDLHAEFVLNVCYLGMNAKHEKMQNIDLRHAIQLAIEREPLEALYHGTARKAWSILSPKFPQSLDASPLQDWNNDVAKRRERAKQLVASSGIGDTELKIYFPKNERPYLPQPTAIADKLRQQLRSIGLNVSIQSVENGEFFPNTKQDDKYELILIGWMSDNGDPDNFYSPLTSSNPETGLPSGNNVARIFDPQVDMLLIKAQTEFNPEVRKNLYRSAESLLQNNVRGYVPLLNAQQAIGTVKRLSGLEVDAMGNYRLYKCEMK